MNQPIIIIIFTLIIHQIIAQSNDSIILKSSFDQPNDRLFDFQPDLITIAPQPSTGDTENPSQIVWPNNLLNLNYTSLVEMKKDCRNSPDRCDYGTKRSRETDTLDCSCDRDCKSIGDCCLDSNELNNTIRSAGEFVDNLNEFNRHKQEFDCKELAVSNSFRFLLVKKSCPTHFQNEFIRNRCEVNSHSSETQFNYNYTDPYQSVPVTSTRTRITYSNIFCALCNEYEDNFIKSYTDLVGEDRSADLKFWKMGVSCEGVMIDLDRNSDAFQNFLKQNFTFDSKNDIWTLEYTNAQGVLDKQSCTLQLSIPEDLHFFIKPCKPNLIDRCLPDWPNDTLESQSVEALCRAYQSRVSHLERKQEYRNVHCAICNLIDINQLGCPSNLFEINEGLSKDDGRSTHLQAFNALFDVNYSIGKSNMVGKVSINNYCPNEDSIYDPFFQKCRSLICGFNQMFSMGECRMPPIIKSIESTNDTVDNRSSDPITIDSQVDSQPNESENELSINELNETVTISNQQKFTADFIKCAKIRLTSGFFELKNDSIHLHQYDLVVDKGNYNLTNSELLICAPFSPLLDKFENHYSSISYICLIFSIICLTLYLIIFSLVPDLRNLSGRNLSSLCVSLIMVYCCFAISPFNLVQKDMKFCKLIAFIKYYGLLASFCWTGVIAFDIYQTIRNSLNAFQYKSGPQNRRFLIYSSICWLLPVLAVIFSWLIDIGQLNFNIPQEYRPNFGQNKECWFLYRKSLLIFFVLPVGVITILNLIFFLLTSKSLLLTSNRNKMKLGGPSSTTKFDFNLYLRLFLLMGLTWMFGFLATYFEKIYLWYLFTLFNTLQGVFIFIEFGCKHTVLKRLKIRLAKLCLIDDSNLSKNSSLSTACRGTPTNQSTITHLNSSNKILSVDHLNDLKTKDHLFNRLNEQNKSTFGEDLYVTRNAGSLNFYSSDHSLNNKSNQQIDQTTNDRMINQENAYQTPSSLYGRPMLNSPSTFCSTIQNAEHNQSSSFKYPYNQTNNITNPSLNSNNSQINRWFDWTMH